jgi:hypothetical protein
MTTKRAKAQEQRLRGEADPQPWHTDADTAGWRTVYRGTGQPRDVRSSVVVELSAEQESWLDTVAEARGLTLAELVGRLIEEARIASQAGAP